MDKLKRLNIELTSVCNGGCVSCPNTDNLLIRGKNHMDAKLFYKIFDEIKNKVNAVYLWNYGDPLLHPLIQDLLEYTRNSSVKKIISTTGGNLADFKDLHFMSAVDEIIISINGLTPKTYKYHQRNGNLKKIIRGVKRLSKTLKNSSTKLIMQTVVNKKNIKNISEFEMFAKKIGFDEIIFKSFNVMDHKEETFKAYVPTNEKYSRYYLKNRKIKNKKMNVCPCKESLVINYNGEVNPCCWDYRGEYILGNILKTKIYVVWNSPKAIKHRKNICTKTVLPICRDCVVNTIIYRKSF